MSHCTRAIIALTTLICASTQSLAIQQEGISGRQAARNALVAAGLSNADIQHSGGVCAEWEIPQRLHSERSKREQPYREPQGYSSSLPLTAKPPKRAKKTIQYSVKAVLRNGNCRDLLHTPNCCNYESVEQGYATVARPWKITPLYTVKAGVLDVPPIPLPGGGSTPAIDGGLEGAIYIGDDMWVGEWSLVEFVSWGTNLCRCGDVDSDAPRADQAPPSTPIWEPDPEGFAKGDVVVDNVYDLQAIDIGAIRPLPVCSASNDHSTGSISRTHTVDLTWATSLRQVHDGFTAACEPRFKEVKYWYVTDIEVTNTFSGDISCFPRVGSGPSNPWSHPGHQGCATGCELDPCIEVAKEHFDRSVSFLAVQGTQSCETVVTGVTLHGVVIGWRTTVDVTGPIPMPDVSSDRCNCEDSPEPYEEDDPEDFDDVIDDGDGTGPGD